ncbi:MAG: hypothetical protein AAGI92_03620 [Pseudomonadota bacterium]
MFPMLPQFTPPLPKGGASPTAEMMAMAPVVMWARTPQMMFEQVWPSWYGIRKDEGERALFEKIAAVAEGYGAMQAEIMHSWMRLFLASMSGETPNAKEMARAYQDICDASVQPSARRVRENYKRLVAKRKPARRRSRKPAA